jgi:Mg2+-importing ATPase
MGFLNALLSRSIHGAVNHHTPPPLTTRLLDIAPRNPDEVLQDLQTNAAGLSLSEAEKRLEEYGPNRVAQEKRRSIGMRFLDNCKNPLVILLTALAVVSFITGDMRATVVISAMVVLGLVLRFFQELRADTAAEQLKAMVTTHTTVMRNGESQETPLASLVPGDLIHLAAGDMVPADVRLITARDLFINQATLTGEALPVEKFAAAQDQVGQNPLELTNICFLGTNVESGIATGIVALTGPNTYFGSLASRIVGQRELTSFDKGIDSFTWLMIRFILVMVPAVFLLNGLSRGNWLEAFLFAMAVAVGLTPEMLPMIVTVNLSKGAILMSRKKVIVKRLNAIQNLGAMDVLCTDKTGTLTQGRIILEQHLDIHGDENDDVLDYAYLNSLYQTGLRSMLDDAVLGHVTPEQQQIDKEKYSKVDEVPFDFVRRRMSVVVEDQEWMHLLICKGAVEEILGPCTQMDIHDEILPLDAEAREKADAVVQGLNEDGFRVVALAYKELPGTQTVYSVRDEVNLILLGFLGFLDPPKETASQAIRELNTYHVQIKVLTGDNDIVTKRICQQVGLPITQIVLGGEIEAMSDDHLAEVVDKANILARLSPTHKERIIKALQRRGHVVGFMGDGINDAPALKAADVGISVDSAVDIAKESSDIILLETSLLVLKEGVIEGRRVFGNITKYIKMAASSNFGNMFSVVGGSIFLPFLPMLPIQILVNNLLYDFSQTMISTDTVDPEWLEHPRQWAIAGLERFIIFIGPLSSIFDYTTFFIMLYVFDAWHKPDLFHTGWFVESLFTQTLIIHVIRTNKIPFVQSQASWSLTFTTAAIALFGMWLPFSPLSHALGFAPLPLLYWVLLVLMMLCYIIIT